MRQRIMNGFLNPEQVYGPTPFWALNDDLKPDRICFCLKELAKKGCAGVIMHARTGLEVDYLSEEWWSSIDVIVTECKKIGLKAWIYDEYNWPSGPAGGKVLDAHPEFLMPNIKSVRMNQGSINSILDSSSEIVAAFSESAKGVRRIGLDEIQGFKGKLLLYYKNLVTDHTFGTTCAPWLSGVSGYIDIMNPEAVDAFMEMTHCEYARRFNEHLGSTIIGLFTDEPQFYRGFPWTHKLPEIFRDLKGYDLLDNLHMLELDVGNYYKFRYDYYQVVEHLYAESYFDKMRKWCDHHSLIFTGHLGQEEDLSLLSLNHGGIYHLLKHMSMPGIDALGDGNPVTGGLVNMESPHFAPRAAASIARSHSDGRVLCEAGGGSGWGATPHTLKYQLDWLFASGVNFVNPHHSLVSIKGLRKRDFPPFHFTPEPWFRYYKLFSDYITRVSMLLSQGKPVQDILLLVPTASMKAAQRGRGCRSKESKKIVDNFNMTMDLLIKNQRDFELLFEEAVEEEIVSISGNKIIFGEGVFDVLVITPCVILSPGVEELLDRYLKGGGKVLLIGSLPLFNTAGREVREELFAQLKIAEKEGRAVIISSLIKEGKKLVGSLKTLHPPDLIVEEFSDEEIIYHHRHVNGLDIYFLTNMGQKKKEATLSFYSYKQVLEKWDPVRAECSPQAWKLDRDGRARTRISFEAGESWFLVWRDNMFVGEENNGNKNEKTNLFLPPLEISPKWELSPVEKNVMFLEPWNVRTTRTEQLPLRDLSGEQYFTWQTKGIIRIGRLIAKLINQLLSPEKKYRTERFFDFAQTEKMQKPASLLTGIKLSRLGLYETTGVMNRLNDYLGLRTFMRAFPPEGASYTAQATVKVNYVPKDLMLVYEDLGVPVEFEINGTPLSGQPEPVQAWDPACLAHRVSGHIKRGLNTITMKSRQMDYRSEVPSTHSIEPVVLQGSFIVRKNTLEELTYSSIREGDWSKRGYPFYSGPMKYRSKIFIPNKYLQGFLCLELGQVWECARVKINGQEAGTRIFPPFTYPISSYVRQGENELEIEVVNTGSNFFSSPRRSGLPDVIRLVLE